MVAFGIAIIASELRFRPVTQHFGRKSYWGTRGGIGKTITSSKHLVGRIWWFGNVNSGKRIGSYQNSSVTLKIRKSVVRRSRQDDPEAIRLQLLELLQSFGLELSGDDLRSKVRALIPSFHLIRDLGSSLVPQQDADSARDRILFYFRKYPLTIIEGDELMVVSGIGEWARRVRELRVQYGWSIVSGLAAQEMNENEEFPIEGINVTEMGPDDYILVDPVQDREAAYRWTVANQIRKKSLGVREKILEFLRSNIGKPVTGEELRYVAKNRTEWARRVRELRTEQGWPVVTKVSGRPDLPIGTYLLEQDRQSPPHDRLITDPVRRSVLVRDAYSCRQCGWNHAKWNPADPRHLELHHVEHHAHGGSNEMENLITVCTICHDQIHSRK
jgi:hypothetical protein